MIGFFRRGAWPSRVFWTFCGAVVHECNRPFFSSMAFPFLKHFIAVLLLCILFSENVMARSVDSRLSPAVKAIQKASPAVVNIFIEENAAVPVNPFQGLRNNFFDSFFQDLIPRYSSKRQSLGSGVLIDSKGYIITNAHVIDKATAIKVTLSDNRQFNKRQDRCK